MGAVKGPYDPFVVGVDIGNATTTVVRGDEVRAFFPSLIGTVGVDQYTGMPVAAVNGGHVTYDGAHAVIGLDALEVPGYDTLLTEGPEHEAHQRYTHRHSIMTLCAAIGSAFAEPEAIAVRLGIGAPLSVVDAWGDQIARAYTGAFSYTHQGRKRRLTVVEARVFGEGREVLRLLPPAERIGKIAVHDIGGRTHGVLLYADGMLRGARSWDTGIDKLLSRVPGVSGDAGARWALQAEMRRSSKAHGVVRDGLAARINEALAHIEAKIRLVNADRHIVIGGGAAYLAPVLRKRYGVAVDILGGDAPEQVNARAYAAAMEASIAAKAAA